MQQGKAGMWIYGTHAILSSTRAWQQDPGRPDPIVGDKKCTLANPEGLLC